MVSSVLTERIDRSEGKREGRKTSKGADRAQKDVQALTGLAVAIERKGYI